jgi:hypothetical protein
MLILGLVLVVVGGAAAAVLIAYNGGGTPQTVFAFGRDIADVTVLEAFIAGIVVSLVFLLGVWMAVTGGRRGREHRARYREARREARLAARERDELADRIRREEEYRADQETVAMERAAERLDEQPTNVYEGQSPTR